MSAPPLQLTINGESRAVQAETLERALAELGFQDATVATALNGVFVPVGRRANTALNQGDSIEILTARQGG